jgi:molybdate transport system substrate-binding protein
MTTRSFRRLAAGLVLPLALLVGCSSSSKSTSTAPQTTAASDTSTTSAAKFSGSLTVFAAASLTGAFNAAKPTLESQNPGFSLTYNFAGSNTLVTQIQQGAPADVFASADEPNMNKLVTAGMVETPVVFVKNKLEIAVAPGNPKHITGLQDLANPGLTVVLCAPGVPAGDYTRMVEQQLGVTITPKSLAPDVKTAITAVSSGEADATVVYTTDVKAAGSSVSGVTIPDNIQPTISYPMAVVKGTHNQSAAEAFVQSAVSGVVQQDLLAAGFLPPT